jgi:sensor histidine kinase YesM
MMEKFEIENVFNQRNKFTHVLIAVFSLIMTFLFTSRGAQPKTPETYINGYLLIFIQVEFFLFLARLVFKDMKTGKTRGEITRIVLSRFAIFLIVCFISALVIIILFFYANNIIHGNSLEGVISRFFRYSFREWFKPTILGLTFGAVIFIIVLWQDALRREQKLREENLIFQNETLKNQINPHFLFNSLNTLSSLISASPETADMFVSRLSAIYRYILENGQKDKIPLKSELAFISDYFDLHKVRDEGKMILNIDIPDTDNYMILPVSLQILIENAIKHNMATRDNPLKIEIYIEDQQIVVKNNLQRMATKLKSTMIGLKNLGERLRLSTGKDLVVEETNDYFVVKLPLLK